MTFGNGARSKYDKLAYEIIGKIKNGDYAPGTKLPTAREIAAETGMSLATINRAVRVLVYHHWAVARPGLGTYVADVLPTVTPNFAVVPNQRSVDTPGGYRLRRELSSAEIMLMATWFVESFQDGWRPKQMNTELTAGLAQRLIVEERV